MVEVNCDTGRHDMQEMTLDLLKEIRDRLGVIEKNQTELEEQVAALSRDVDTVHKFQQSFAERLSILERSWVDQPLRSTPLPKKVRKVGNDGGR